MGKYSTGTFARRDLDKYDTPYKAVTFLLPYLGNIRTFAEPCAGTGDLRGHLEHHGLKCAYQNDISWPGGIDAREYLHDPTVDAIITNPPWARPMLHALIRQFQSQAPTWLIFQSDWAQTVQAIPFLDQCSHIVPVRRLIWIAGTKTTGKENSCWYRFDAQHTGGPHFYNRPLEARHGD